MFASPLPRIHLHLLPKRLTIGSPSLALFEVALFHHELHSGPVFCGQSSGEQAFEFGDASGSFYPLREIF
jgi:hypothetical protein